MLPDFAGSHSPHLTLFRNENDLSDYIDQPMESHQTDDNNDRYYIYSLDDARRFGLQSSISDPMNRSSGKSGRNAGMAIPACFLQVIGMDRRFRISAGKNLVNAVAGSAIGDMGITRLGFQSMIAVDKRSQSPGPQPVFFGQGYGFVTGRTSSLCLLVFGFWGRGFAGREDAVLAVAVRANR
jgi:hypothetical protein